MTPMPAFPEMAFSHMMFWVLALIVASAFVKLGGILMNRLWYRNGERDRRNREQPDWFKIWVDAHKEFVESNRRVSEDINRSNMAVSIEIKEFSRGLNILAETLGKRSDRAFDEHAEILQGIHELQMTKRRSA